MTDFLIFLFFALLVAPVVFPILFIMVSSFMVGWNSVSKNDKWEWSKFLDIKK